MDSQRLLIRAHWFLTIRSASAEHARRQHDDGAQQVEHGFDADPEQAEGQQQQPDQRVQDQGQQGDWPAQEQQAQPDKESQHCLLSSAWFSVDVFTVERGAGGGNADAMNGGKWGMSGAGKLGPLPSQGRRADFAGRRAEFEAATG
jgi:hypothetical protein